MACYSQQGMVYIVWVAGEAESEEVRKAAELDGGQPNHVRRHVVGTEESNHGAERLQKR